MEQLYFEHEFTYDFGDPPHGVFDQTQFGNRHYKINTYSVPPFRNIYTIYQVKCGRCQYLCETDRSNNEKGFILKLEEFDHSNVRALLAFHYNKYQGTKKDFLSYCQHLINQDAWTWLIQDKFKITILFDEIASLQKISNPSLQVNGLQSNLTDDQIWKLFDQLKGKFIDTGTNSDYFKAALKPEPLPQEFKAIKWLVAKAALRDFLTFISVHKNKSNERYLPDEIAYKRTPILFVDHQGKGIKLDKPKGFSKYFTDFETIIKRL